MGIPEYLYHYTSLDTLALILNNRTICFNSLLNVDDVDEAETSDLGTFGKYVYVSCWTDEANESIAMWQMYTPNMHGIRIRLPIFPFKKHHYKKGEMNFGCDVDSYIDFKRIYDDNNASIVSDLPKLIPVTYTVDDSLLHPKVRSGASFEEYCDAMSGKTQGNKEIHYNLDNLGRFKTEGWRFQKEWRYWLSMSPMGMREYKVPTFDTQIEFLRRLEDPRTKPPYERFFLELSYEAVAQMEVVFGPRMTEAEKILAKHLLKGNGLDGCWRDSMLRIR